MSLKNIEGLKIKYRNKHDDVISDFYNPCLLNSKTYKRAVGYFSSSILANIAIGLSKYLQPGNKIQLLISPEISKEDFEVISAASFNNYSIDFLMEKLSFSQDKIDTSRYSLLYHLIKLGVLEIRFAIVTDFEKSAIYHEKIGIFIDEFKNSVIFVGSSNETEAAVLRNYESFLVFKSWDQNQGKYCEEELDHFDKLWDGADPYIKTLNITKAIEEKVLKFSSQDPYYFDKVKQVTDSPSTEEIKTLDRIPKIDERIKLKPYQLEAIHNFILNNFLGVYSMSTGSGKTFTAAGTIVRTYEIKKKLFVVVVAPFLHLVDQWEDELENFNIKPLKIYGLKDSWVSKLKRQVQFFKQKLITFSCVIVTNKTFSDNDFQSILSEIQDNTFLIVDEAHNFGSKLLLSQLNPSFPYRLALSATIERHNDEDGTKNLINYFGKIVIEYNLKNAILDGVLTNYYYYPILVNLTDTELSMYLELTDKISKLQAINSSSDKTYGSKEIEMLLIRRSRIVAGAQNKLIKLFEIIKSNFLDEKNILIYCGAIKYGDIDTFNIQEDIKQIDYVQKELGIKHGMKVSKFTSQEDKEERRNIIKEFKDNELQALVAIKCLDEGVNIPAIKTAFILASSTNPRQYIQRRGRLLRTHPGKKFAYIYDFITITRPLNELEKMNLNSLKKESRLAMNEIKRMIEFSEIALNTSDSSILISKLLSSYKLDIIDSVDGGDYE
jgi:superfamily II DNA or RNA helicase